MIPLQSEKRQIRFAAGDAKILLLNIGYLCLFLFVCFGIDSSAGHFDFAHKFFRLSISICVSHLNALQILGLVSLPMRIQIWAKEKAKTVLEKCSLHGDKVDDKLKGYHHFIS